jgi:NTP pyrophosphatase (non-canonical NTP hydrolase)
MACTGTESRSAADDPIGGLRAQCRAVISRRHTSGIFGTAEGLSLTMERNSEIVRDSSCASGPGHQIGHITVLWKTDFNPVFNANPQAGRNVHSISAGLFLAPAVRNEVSRNTVGLSIMPPRRAPAGQIVLFPPQTGDTVAVRERVHEVSRSTHAIASAHVPVVLSGSYRRDFEGLRRTYEELKDLDCDVLSPSNVNAVNELDGFVYMRGEEQQPPDAIEARHLDAIQRSQFMWLHAPGGYVGTSAALEVGFAHAVGIPVFAKESVDDLILRGFVQVVASPETVLARIKNHALPVPQPALKAFQQYYRRAAVQRGYHSEGPKECLLLMVEEVGELAREIRKREKLVRHGEATFSSESRELADIFLYVVHMANVLDVDLSRVVQDKELTNLQRSLATERT